MINKVGSREALLRALEEANVGTLFRTVEAQSILFRKIAEFGTTYEQSLEGVKAGLPLTATLEDIIAEHAVNPYRVHMLLQALAFNCSSQVLVMVWMTLLGSTIEKLSYNYIRESASTIEATLLLPDRSTRLDFRSSDHWDAAVLRFASLATSNGKPVIDGFFAMVIPNKKGRLDA